MGQRLEFSADFTPRSRCPLRGGSGPIDQTLIGSAPGVPFRLLDDLRISLR